MVAREGSRCNAGDHHGIVAVPMITARRLAAFLFCCCVLFLGTARSTQAADPAEVAIRAALAKWTADFNARDSSLVCDLFAPDLVYDYRGFPERDYAELCALLRRSLADDTRRFSYSLDVKEIIVSGDLAVVRLVWTLDVTSAGASQATRSTEPGLDIFRRQPDGSWRIARFLAFEAP
jgi:uncharacterized protein (TIGR02246 family)